MPKPYSLRDLRAAFRADELRSRFGGDYDIDTRRWSFSTKDARNDAERLLRHQSIATLHVPGANAHMAAIRRVGGFSVFDRYERPDREMANQHGSGFFIFRTDEEAREATILLYNKLEPSPELLRKARAALAAASADLFASPNADLEARLVDGFAFPHECHEIISRSENARAYAARNAAEYDADVDAAVEDARDLTGQPYDSWERIDAPRGTIEGLLVGRSRTAIAVEGLDGTLRTIPRAPIATPLRKGGSAERSLDRGAPIHVSFSANGAGFARQRKREDGIPLDAEAATFVLDILALRTMAARPDFAPIMHVEQHLGEDMVGQITAREDGFASVLDRAGYATIISESQILFVDEHHIARAGPSFGAPLAPKLLQRNHSL